MFYKVLLRGKIIDVLDRLLYAKYQLKHKILLLCPDTEAELVLSSDRKNAYHTSALLSPPTDIFDTVTIEEIDRYEYEKLKTMNLKSPEEIAESIILELMERGVL